ncbi:MAG TPA: hypothetical protein VG939_09380 [Caulobacteraceae bacterium]|nr:hypothetical protein [Caulobacteraceae bacterium]
MAAPFNCPAISPLPLPPRGWHAVAFCPLADGSLGCLQATADIAGIERQNRSLLERGITNGLKPYFMAGDRGRLASSTEPEAAAEYELDYPFPRFDKRTDGTWVVVASRCLPGQANARYLSPTGDLIRRFPVGDGVADVQADSLDALWVSHFDEGVFGDDPLGQGGLVRFDANGSETWRANAPPWDRPPIDDCYALNVVGEAAWACHYCDFPILRVGAAGEARLWNNGVRGASALAVDGRHVVLFGGYEGARSRIALLELGDRNAAWIGELELVGPEAARAQATGRGDTIHLIDEASWRRFTVGEIVRAVAEAGDAATPDYEADGS